MGGYFSLSSEIRIKDDVNENELKEDLESLSEYEGDGPFEVESDRTLQINIYGDMSHEFAFEFEDEWVKFVKKYADLTSSVLCYSEDNGVNREWYIGPRNLVLLAIEAAVNAEILLLRDGLEAIEKDNKGDPDKIISLIRH